MTGTEKTSEKVIMVCAVISAIVTLVLSPLLAWTVSTMHETSKQVTGIAVTVAANSASLEIIQQKTDRRYRDTDAKEDFEIRDRLTAASFLLLEEKLLQIHGRMDRFEQRIDNERTKK